MKITETRKQIIKLLEPYMEKELSPGCIVFIPYRGGDYYIQRYKDHYENMSYGLDNGYTIQPVSYSYDWTIYGHYDITALLKYIRATKKVYVENNLIETDKITFDLLNMDGVFSIPNKPLYLYTKKEENNLLELLKRLGTENKK